ncbi:GNAT family N-acetyltransferase [Acetanaerobacterium elongatum]|uniref:Acetyltransferase (GNAT) domain-containing protein n=1 Tax=Acetanaerobacterium elongatum TaxID=258515 RepID=A0A1H0FHE1_9FIRM|nr:GNAT family N-acetyltransferase [Acetanaerobacterium elongatum]SDN94060.1 Acetyltransferase (GNAT) domain-containing protein [Acetanaerobacterium elongatum]
MTAYEIKAVQDAELDTCANVIRQSFLTVAKDFGLTPENCPSNGAFMKNERLLAEKEKGNLMYALYADDIIVGFAAIGKLPDGTFTIEKLAVLPEYRHNGYGRVLIDYAKEQIKRLGGTKISIGIIEENIVLKNWYMTNGFKSTGTKVFEHLPFTVGFMEYNL